MSRTNPMLDDFERSLLQEIEARAESLVADLALLVGIPTGHNHAEGLDRTRDWFADRLRALGAAIELVPGTPRPGWLEISSDPRESPSFDEAAASGDDLVVPPTLVARRPVDDGREGVGLVLCGHLDTVHDPRGSFRELSPVIDGIAHGPGVMDMKGGLLVGLAALEVLESRGRRIDWTMVLVSDEETGTFFGEQAILDAARGRDVGLVFEPALPDGSLVVERMGSGTFMLEAIGRAAHVGRAFSEGRSAVVALARGVVALSRLADPEAGRIVNIGPLHGGGVTNAVPHHARCWGNVRYADAAAQTGLEADMHTAIESLSDDLAREISDPPELRLRTAFLRPAKPATPEVLALAEKAREVSEALGRPLPFASTGGACDGNILQAAGVPTIDTLGVRGGGMHRADEHVEVVSLVERAGLLAILMHRLDRDGFAERPGSGRSIP